MAWIIDKDLLNSDLPDCNMNGRTFGKYVPQKSDIKFKLYDDDDELYYCGRMSAEQFDKNPFAPLDWGMSYAGTTYMKVREQNMECKWKWNIL